MTIGPRQMPKEPFPEGAAKIVYAPPGAMRPTPLLVVNHMSLPLAAMQPTPLMAGAGVLRPKTPRGDGVVSPVTRLPPPDCIS